MKSPPSQKASWRVQVSRAQNVGMEYNASAVDTVLTVTMLITMHGSRDCSQDAGAFCWGEKRSRGRRGGEGGGARGRGAGCSVLARGQGLGLVLPWYCRVKLGSDTDAID